MQAFYFHISVRIIQNEIRYLSLLQTQWLLDPLLERKLPVMSDCHDQPGECENAWSTLTNHQKMIVFSSSLVKEIFSVSNESTPGLKTKVIRRDCLVRLWLESSWVRHWCTCVLGCSEITEVINTRSVPKILFVITNLVCRHQNFQY